MKKTRTLQICSLVGNVAIIVLTWYSLLALIFGGVSGNMSLGVSTFRYFTNLSNILVAMTASIILPFNINGIIHGKNEIPLWAQACKFVGTVSVTVTFLTVILFLGPMFGWEIMFAGPCLYLHLITPLLAIFSFCVAECENKYPFYLTYIGLAPTFVYSILYLFMVAIFKRWEDFYGFTFGGKMWVIPISLIAMYIATYVFAVGNWALQNLCHKKIGKGK